LQTHGRVTSGFRERVGINGNAVVVTLHRPSNVDDAERLAAIAGALREVAKDRPVVFPMHPRTAKRVREAGISLGAVRLLEPVGYYEMLDLVDGAFAVVTDSGGVQEETTVLGITFEYDGTNMVQLGAQTPYV
jgi:UDP-N-acetylglucosamine 2-epimerase (non-hydrolysing)